MEQLEIDFVRKENMIIWVDTKPDSCRLSRTPIVIPCPEDGSSRITKLQIPCRNKSATVNRLIGYRKLEDDEPWFSMNLSYEARMIPNDVLQIDELIINFEEGYIWK